MRQSGESRQGSGLLEVAVRHLRDVPGSVDGGADRLTVSTSEGLSPEPSLVSSIVRSAAVPVRAVLRLSDHFTTSGGEFTRLIGLAQEYLALGAEGVEFGFLDSSLELDLDTDEALAAALPGVPWTHHEAIDHTLDLRRSWRSVKGLAGVTAVRSAGSPRGLEIGYDDLLAAAEADAALAAVLAPGPGLLAEHVPWLVRAGVHQFHVGSQVRPGGSVKADVDAGLVRSWRLLVDDAVARARPQAQ